MSDVHLITGDDEAMVFQESRKAVERLAGPEPDEFSFEVYCEDENRSAEAVLAELCSSLRTPPFLGGHKTVWLKDFGAFAEEAAAKGRPAPVGAALAKLVELVATEFPPDVTLVMNGVGIDKRKRLFRLCNSEGTVAVFNKPDLGKPGGREQVARMIKDAAAAHGMRLERGSIDFLGELVGGDARRLGSELEKLYCYAGEAPTAEQVREVCTGNREAVYYALNAAIGKRNLKGSFEAVERLLAMSKDPEGAVIGVVRRLGSFLRELLHAMVLLRYLRVSRPGGLESAIGGMSAAQKEDFAGNLLISRHPYLVRMRAEEAQRYSGPELLRALSLLAEADKQLVSSSLPRRLLLETLVLQIVQPAGSSPRG